MNRRIGSYILLAALCLTGLFSCLGGSDGYEYEISTDAQLTSFSLSHDSLAVLAKAKFSIDQANSLIYNYDSLPFLTDTAIIASRAIVKYTAGSGSAVSIRLEYLDGDTTWIASGDSMRFAASFSLQLYAPSGKSKTYNVRVNVHSVDPDSIQYRSSTMAEVPVLPTPDWATLTQDCPDNLEVVACLGFLRPDEQRDLALVVKDEDDDLRFAFTKDLVDYQLGDKIPEGFPLTGFTIFNNRSFAGLLTIISSLQSVWATEDGLYWTNLFGTGGRMPLIEGGNAFAYNGEIWFMNGRVVAANAYDGLVNGGYNSKIFFSIDGGVVWREKPQKMQPPTAFPLRQDATVVVDEDGDYFYIVGGRNAGVLNDVWKAALNSRLFEH